MAGLILTKSWLDHLADHTGMVSDSGPLAESGACRDWPILTLLIQDFPGGVIRGISACTRVPHRESNFMGGVRGPVGY